MKLVTIETDVDSCTHILCARGFYATLCGMDGDDDNCGVQQKTIQTPKNGKVNCTSCIDIWKQARKVKACQIADSIRNK